MSQSSLQQLVYTSIASTVLDAGDLFKLVETALANNAKAEITGVLVFANGRFFQAIEGEVAQVEALIGRIANDSKHHSIVRVLETNIEHRQFYRWRMRRINVVDESGAWREFQRLVATHRDALSILEGFESYLALEQLSAA